MPPLVATGLRSLTAGLLLLPFAIIIAARAQGPPSLRQLGAAALSGAALLAVAQGLIVWGVHLLPAGVAAVFGSSSPLFVAVFGWAMLGERLSTRQVAGIATGFVGIALLAFVQAGSGTFSLAGAAAVLGGAAAWAAASLYEHRSRLPNSMVVLVAVQMLTAGALLVPVWFATGELKTWHAADVARSSWLALGYLAIGGSLIAITTFTWLNRTVSSVVANSFNYVAPVVATGFAAVLLDEGVTLAKLGAAGLTLVGVALMVTGRKQGVEDQAAPSSG